MLKLGWKRSKLIWPYIFLLPFFLLFAVFIAWPIAYSFYLSLFEKVGLGKGTYIGFQNYLKLLKDPVFRISLKNTLWYVIGTLLFQIPLALFLAIIVNSPMIKMKSFLRGIFFLPVITSGVAISIIFSILLDYRYGLLNMIMEKIGLNPINWLQDMKVVMNSIIMIGIWRYAGQNMVYFLAGLQGISEELYEAAKVDGANKWQLFRHITLPSLMPTIVFVIIMHMIGAFQVFDVPFLITGGGPANASTTINIYLYRNAFTFFNMGYGSAIAYALVCIILTISIIQLKIFGVFRGE